MYSLSEKKGRFTINAQLITLGDDLLVVIRGGKEHIGAVGMAQPRVSLADATKISATSSVFTYVGHKEDVVVKTISEEISKRLNKKVVVVAGIHWDELSSKDIRMIMKLCVKVQEKIIMEVQKWARES